MKKLLSLGLLIVALFGISAQSSAYVNYAENYVGNYVYTSTCSYKPTNKIPITSTQALHTHGYTQRYLFLHQRPDPCQRQPA